MLNTTQHNIHEKAPIAPPLRTRYRRIVEYNLSVGSLFPPPILYVRPPALALVSVACSISPNPHHQIYPFCIGETSSIIPALLHRFPHALGIFPTVILVEVRGFDVGGGGGIGIVQ